MNNKKLPSLLALSICLELILSPMPALAQQNGNLMNGVSSAINFGAQVYNTFRTQGQAQMPPHVATDMVSLQKQQTPTPDKHFTLANMQKIPGLMEYIAKKNKDAATSGGKAINPLTLNCTTLPSTLYEANTEICRNKTINTMSGDPKVQADEAFAYYNQYLQIGKLYSNYTVKKNDGSQSFGTGCMLDAMAVLQGFFAYRVEQLGVISTKLESLIEGPGGFIEKTEADLMAIRESSAILNGERSGFASEFKDSQIFDYGKRFADPACNSILSKDDMNGLGKSGGLLGLEDKFKKDLNTVPPGSKHSPDQYLKHNADIVSDIKKMADKVAEQSDLNFGSFARSKEGYSAFIGSVGGDVGSESGANLGLNKAFFSDLQTKFSKTSNNLNSEAKLLMSELGGGSEAAMQELGNIDSDANFSAEMTSLENKIKGSCVNNAGIDTALASIYDPTLSKSASKHSSEQIKKRIKSFINDVTMSPAQKLQKLNELEAQGGSRYEIKMDADYKTSFVKADGTVGTKDVNAANKVTPGSYFTDLINNCESQFQVNKLNNKLSGKEAIKKLWALKKTFQKEARQHSKDIKNEIIKKMIDCGGNGAVASSSGVGSCSPAKLDMSSTGFCTKAAFSCSNNIKKCTDKAQKFVTQIKDDRSKRRDHYNQAVETTRKQMVTMFDTSLGQYMKEAESLRGMFGVGFEAPTGIERDLKGKTGLMSEAPYAPGDAGDTLDLKDPKKYMEMVKGNIEKLKAQVKAQQEAIMGDNGPLFKHIQDTSGNYEKEVISKAKKIEGDCLAAYNSYKDMLAKQKEASDKQMAEAQKMNNTMGEKNGAFCGAYIDIMSDNPNGACKEDIRSLATASINASNAAGQMNDNTINSMVSEMNARCALVGKDLEDAQAVCADDPEGFLEIFKEKSSLKTKNFREACTAMANNGIPAGYCLPLTKPTGVKSSVDSKDQPQGTAEQDDKYASCGTWMQPDPKVFTWTATCIPVQDPGKTANCEKVEKDIMAVYSTAKRNGDLTVSATQSNPMPYICNRNNNSGPYLNDKSNQPGGNNGNPMLGGNQGMGI